MKEEGWTVDEVLRGSGRCVSPMGGRGEDGGVGGVDGGWREGCWRVGAPWEEGKRLFALQTRFMAAPAPAPPQCTTYCTSIHRTAK